MYRPHALVTRTELCRDLFYFQTQQLTPAAKDIIATAALRIPCKRHLRTQVSLPILAIA